MGEEILFALTVLDAYINLIFWKQYEDIYTLLKMV